MKRGTSALLAIAALPGALAASMNICTEQTCTDCPDGLILTAATDGKPCIIYDTTDITSGGGFPPVSGGTQPAWLNATPDPNTGLIIRSPADTGSEYCGLAVGNINKADVCGAVQLKDTFTVEICTGTTECVNHGLPGGPYEPSAKLRMRGTTNMFSARKTASEQYTVAALTRPDGTLVRPLAAVMDGRDFIADFYALFNATDQLQLESPTQTIERRSVYPTATQPQQHTPSAAGSNCKFTADSPDGYIRSDAYTTSVGNALQGQPAGGSFTATSTVESSWSTTSELGLNLDIFSASVSFTVEKSISKSVAYTINVPANQTGYAGFTPFYKCTTGTNVCDGTTTTGEACAPYTDNGGNPAGEFSFVQNFS